ncbi:hypothetical protein YC2023_050866 [Brassica napus]
MELMWHDSTNGWNKTSTDSTSKHAKCHFVAIDIFTTKMLKDIVLSSYNCNMKNGFEGKNVAVYAMHVFNGRRENMCRQGNNFNDSTTKGMKFMLTYHETEHPDSTLLIQETAHYVI